MSNFADPNNHQRIKVRGGITPVVERPQVVNYIPSPRYWNNTISNLRGPSSIGVQTRQKLPFTHEGAGKIERSQVSTFTRSFTPAHMGRHTFNNLNEISTGATVLDPYRVQHHRHNPLSMWTENKEGRLPEFWQDSNSEIRFEVSKSTGTPEDIKRYIQGDPMATFYETHKGDNPLLWGNQRISYTRHKGYQS